MINKAPNLFQQKVINGFTFLDVIGKGSFGEVYKASKQNQEFAIKTIDKAVVKQKKLEKYVKNEVKIQKQLDNKYIVKLYETFEDETFLYIVLEYCNQGTLFQYIIDKKPNLDESLQIFVQVLRGFRAIHEKKFLHRDLKPENIFIKSNVYKIADFGLSRPTDLGSTYCGTSYFMAPEILQRLVHDYKCDLWSLGVMLYFMLFREYPFKNKQDLLKEIKEKTEPSFNLVDHLRKPWQKERINDELINFFKKVFVMNPQKRITFEQLYDLTLFEKYFDEGEQVCSRMLYQSLASSGNPENMDEYSKEEFKTVKKQTYELNNDIREQFKKLTQQEHDNDLHNILEELSPEVKIKNQFLQSPRQQEMEQDSFEDEPILEENVLDQNKIDIIQQQLKMPGSPKTQLVFGPKYQQPNLPDVKSSISYVNFTSMKSQASQQIIEENSQNQQKMKREQFYNSVRGSSTMQVLEQTGSAFESHVIRYLYEIGHYTILADTIDHLRTMGLGPSSHALVCYLLSKMLLFMAINLRNSFIHNINIFKLEKWDSFSNTDHSSYIRNKLDQDINVWTPKFLLFYYGIDQENEVHSMQIKKLLTEDICERDFFNDLLKPIKVVLELAFKAGYQLGLQAQNDKSALRYLRPALMLLYSININKLFEFPVQHENFHNYFLSNEIFEYNNFSNWINQLNKNQLIAEIQHINKRVNDQNGNGNNQNYQQKK